MAIQTKNIGILRKVCDALPQCVGFNSNGWLKKKIGQKYKASVDLYLKESAPVSIPCNIMVHWQRTCTG